MSNNKLDAFFDKLVEALIIDLAFYIPSDIILTGVLEELEGSIPENYLNELTVLDPMGFSEFEINEFNTRLIKKKNQLEKNIFKLLERKTTLEAFDFEFILNKYFKQLEFYLAITNWLRINLRNYNKEIIKLTTIGSFEIQYEIYNSHFNDLLIRFQRDLDFSLKEEFTISELLKNYFPEMMTRYQMISVKENDTSEIQNKADIKSQNLEPTTKIELGDLKKTVASSEPKMKKQKLVIDDHEVELFLLETVFNITSVE